MITSSTDIEVRYAETDMMGVAHHASYLPWLEIARGNLLKERGVSYAKLEESGIMLPVVEIKMNYRRPATYDDIVTINSVIKERPFAKIRVDYELQKRGSNNRQWLQCSRFYEPIRAPHQSSEIHKRNTRQRVRIKSPKRIRKLLPTNVPTNRTRPSLAHFAHHSATVLYLALSRAHIIEIGPRLHAV